MIYNFLIIIIVLKIHFNCIVRQDKEHASLFCTPRPNWNETSWNLRMIRLWENLWTNLPSLNFCG